VRKLWRRFLEEIIEFLAGRVIKRATERRKTNKYTSFTKSYSNAIEPPSRPLQSRASPLRAGRRSALKSRGSEGS